ncbi:MAG TPA: ATP-binding cassette domain-containing protein [Rhizomicrobium sp.]|nr:ATP-binding cassette domain-containing protein [Rhizomicrobium sp.]
MTFDLEPGKAIAVTGRSGAGKSLLLRALGGLETLSEGRLSLAGAPVGHHDEAVWNNLRKHLGLVLDQAALLHDLSLEENLAFPLVKARLATQDLNARLEHALVTFNLHPWRSTDVTRLSPTQIRRALLARALIMEPKILLLDSPFDGLDPEARRELVLDLDRLVRRQHVALLFTCHDVAGFEQLADTVFLLERGQLTKVR